MHMAGAPLLLTKLDVPPPRAHTLPRERLLARMPQAQGARLVLVSAPAGFGKTTFLSTWCHALAAQHGTAVAWLSLEEGDNDPARFLSYLLAAAGRAMGLPERLAEAVDSPPEPAGEGVLLARLINALAALDRECVLVLDDYHVISAPPIHAAVAFLIEHLPEHTWLAIGSRSDPPLPLARLRAHQQLVELRAAELRFTLDEIETFLKATGQLDLTPDEIQAIAAYVEGWPAGVQLVALALNGEAQAQPEPSGDRSVGRMLARIAASQRHVFAFLADDVFERQPAHLKAFLLQTAILDRMCGPLCDAVLGLTNEQRPATSDQNLTSSVVGHSSLVDSYSRLILEQLERTNLFVMPLDGQQHWYRYHNLFRAFLCARIEREPKIVVADLHRRASAWYAQHGQLPSALEHALAAGATESAAALIERLSVATLEGGEYATLHGWLDHIPSAILAARPALSLSAAWAALLAGEVEQVAPLVARAEQAWLAAGDQRRLGELAHLQAHLARLRHDAEGTLAAARRALADLDAEDRTLIAGSTLALGAGQILSGDLAAAGATLAEALAGCREHNFLGMVVAQMLLGDLAAQRGRLADASASYQEAIRQIGGRDLWERWEITARLGELARERNDLAQARDTLRTALAAAERSGVAAYLIDGYVALARTLAASGDLPAAEAALDRALRAALRLAAPARTHVVRAYQARLALARGDMAAAERWQSEAAPALERDISTARTAEALTLARILIAQGARAPKLGGARALLARLRQNAEARGHVGALVEILALDALAADGGGEREQATRIVRRALSLGAAGGYARVFLDEGARMRSLIADCRPQIASCAVGPAAPEASESIEYVDGLLSAFERELATTGHGFAPRPPAQAPGPKPQVPDADALSEREVEVLQLIASGASNNDIADTLVISVGTVKSHINHILGKLSARSRTEAVARARARGLLAT